MENTVKTKIDLLIENLSILKKYYRWSVGDLTLRFIALLYILSNKTFDKNEFDEMATFIKKNSKWFSYYRGHQMYSTAALLITKFDHPQQDFIRLLEYENKMKQNGFKSSPYLGIAAYALLLTSHSDAIDHRLNKAMEIYKEMKNNHFWLTSSEDYPIAVLLSESAENVNTLISEIEHNYDLLLSEGFKRSNGLQFLSHLLSFSPENARDKAQRTRRIYERMKEEKLHVSTTYYGILGYLSLLGEMSYNAVEEVIKGIDYIKAHKHFKWTYKDMNVLTITSLVTNEYLENENLHKELLKSGIGISIEAMIAAQTAALIAATTAATSSATAASTSQN